ncbi:MAG: lipoyl(octanoyl) transferase LipB [bacterium]|nr:lipoyl(octanoyl) transferase LipB [bacterium]
MQPFEVEDLGRAAYGPVLIRMRELHERVQRGEAPGRILLVEHEPVYTAGRRTPAADLAPEGVTSDPGDPPVEIVPIERGGQITYHGPGQLVVYPIVPLPRRDVRDWLRRLEAFGVAFAAEFGLAATPSVDGTGVFVGTRKFASIGVALKRWVNLHGISLNIAMDRAPWRRVQPCGLDPEVMTDLSAVLGRAVTMAEARATARAVLPGLTDTSAEATDRL